MKKGQLILGLVMGVFTTHAGDDNMKLWYKEPVPQMQVSLPWEQQKTNAAPNQRDFWESRTLPVGNGRIGGTCYSGTALDCVTLNEVSLWSGGPNEPGNGNGYSYGPQADKNSFGSYQPFANLYVAYQTNQQVESYTRTLDLNTAIQTTSFTEQTDSGSIKHTRECFVSRPDNVMVYHASAEGKAGALTAQVALLPFHDVEYTRAGSNTLIMRGTLRNGEEFEGRVKISVADGSFKIVGSDKKLAVNYQGKGDGMRPAFDAANVPYISISNASEFTLIISLATNYKMSPNTQWKGASPASRNEKILRAVKGKSYNDLLANHLRDYQAYYKRLKLDLGRTDENRRALPTNERLRLYRQDANDPELEALVYQYGRYVLIAGSQPGNLPVNLQGIWNNKVHAAWACDYHNNINLQMCYWGAEVANLSECHLPLIKFIDVMQKPLADMTRRQFGPNVRGWTTRISQNPWGGGGWVKWNPPVNAWYALHVWDHYLFTQDETYLRKTAYPILKNICHFWEDQLKEVGQNGEGLVSDGKPLSVQQHPELAELKPGTLVAPNGWSHEWGPIEDGCAHDQQLVWELFDITAQAANILGIDAKFAKSITEKKNRLAGNRIGSGGYLQEWIVDRPDKVSGHRHTSHLIGVYPGSTISQARTPELAQAAMKSLELRGLSGDNRRSWTWPWRTALWARFHRPELAYDMVRNYLTHNTLDNLFGNHPPMQMDGTYGMTGGMSEMLVQSHAGQIELLPALPKAWKDGSVQGLRARGNITINMSWKDGRVTNLQLTTTTPKPAPVNVLKNGEVITMTPTYVKPE